MIYQLLTWQAGLDILVIAAGFFFLYRTLIGLGTWKIVSGVMIALLVFFAASLLDLRGVEWIYRNLSHVLVISLVVLFQPELRKLFERAAASVSRRHKKGAGESDASLIAKGLWRLAEEKTGALVVISGREDVSAWARGGFRLGAEPSLPLILSLFDASSPGHDGALIFSHGRFTIYGSRLPVSQSGRLSNDFGTRHQAGMGMSEKTDALVLAVSEERGQVSMFKNGNRTLMESEAAIAAAIADHGQDQGLLERAGQDKTVRKALVLEGAGSLAAALVFWMVLISGSGEMIEKVLTVPVEYTATAEDVAMTGEKANEVRLHLAGTRSDLDMFALSDARVKIDLAKAGAGRRTVVISEENIRLPRGVKIVDVEPSSIQVELARLSRVVLPVRPQLVGSLPKGVKIAAMTVQPDSLAVFLPLGRSGTDFKSITTTPIYLDGIRDDLVLFCKIITPPAIQPVDGRWPDVEVRLTLNKSGQ